MKTKVIAIVGGSQKQTFEKVAKKHHCQILFHDGKTGGGKVDKQFNSMIRKADAVVILKGAVNHHSMWAVRDLAEKMGKPLAFQDGFGATGAIEKGIQMIS